MAQFTARATNATWVMVGATISGAFSVQTLPNKDGASAILQVTTNTTAPTSRAGARWLPPEFVLDGDSLAAVFGLASAARLWVATDGGAVEISVATA